jgi:hypothetical protein
MNHPTSGLKDSVRSSSGLSESLLTITRTSLWLGFSLGITARMVSGLVCGIMVGTRSSPFFSELLYCGSHMPSRQHLGETESQ